MNPYFTKLFPAPTFSPPWAAERLGVVGSGETLAGRPSD
jgi:hypothetical protein